MKDEILNKNQNHDKPDSHNLLLIIEGKEYKWNNQYISGAEIKNLGNLQADCKILLAIARPWEDEVIENETEVDLARPGIENFHIYKPEEGVVVIIHINDVEYKVKRGKYSVADLKKIAKVPNIDELDELINKKLTPLKEDQIVLIKGCEQFFSHVRDGSSS